MSLKSVGLGFVAIVSLLVVGCSKSEDEFFSLPHFAPVDPHVSPFLGNKVIVGTDAAKGSQRTLVAVIDNECAKVQCPNAGTGNRLSCSLYHRPDRLQNPVQYHTFELAASASIADLTRSAQNDSCVIGISEEKSYKMDVYNDTYFNSNQANYLSTVRYQQSLTYFTPARLDPVKVAVIDSGVGMHPDLGGVNDLPGVMSREDLRSNASKSVLECASAVYTNENPSNPHGTFVGGIIAARANNNLGVAGVAQNARLISLAVGDCKGRISTTEVANALQTALQRGAKVVNVSLGGATGDDIAVRHAIHALLNSKAIVVVSAGNWFQDLRTIASYPAAYGLQYFGVIPVAWGMADGTLNFGDRTTYGSNFSPDHVKILAPGTGIASTMNPATANGYAVLGNGYGIGQGSSFSAPIVSGAVAMLIGYFNKHNIDYDERMIEYLLLEKGTTRVSDLNVYVKNGNVLNMEKLGQIADYIRQTGETPRDMNVQFQQMSYNTTREQSMLELQMGWNLESTHFGSRIGVFDGSCAGYSAPCLIQDFELTGNSGSRGFLLSRNDLLPMLPKLEDPDLNLYLNVAIYYKIPGKNNYGVDAVKRVNIRDIDASTATSAFTGKITNIRMDMQNLYVSGWACLEMSNRAVPVELVNANNVPQIVKYAYFYPYMADHGTPIDKASYSQRGGKFMATGINLMQQNRSAYKSGLEANPKHILPCKTLTAAHGFEFAYPLQTIAEANLSGTKYSIRATHPNQAANKLLLKDDAGNTQFTIPDVNYQTTVPSTVSITRGADITVAGSVCSKSLSPIHMEVSFSEWDFRCRLKNKANFPDFADACSLGGNSGLPMVNDPQLTDRNQFVFHYFDGTPKQRESDLELDAASMQRHLALYPVRWPNSTLDSRSAADFPAFLNSLIARGIREVDSGAPLARVQYGYTVLTQQGSAVQPVLLSYSQDRAGVSIRPHQLADYWDYNDTGEYYTDSVVAYEMNPESTVGEYLLRTYSVRKLMREVKKYEVPLGVASYILANEVIPKGTRENNACPYRFNVNKQIPAISNNMPQIQAIIRAYLKANEPLIANAPIIDPNLAIREVPLDIRFFQDGVMILHLLSNYGSQTTPVRTLR